MGWNSATDIMDIAVRAMTTTAAEVFQVASGNEGARTPALANWLNESPENRFKLDDAMRRGVREVAAELLKRGWDAPEEADAFDRFRQEMLGLGDEDFRLWLIRQQAEAETHDDALNWSNILRQFDNSKQKGRA